MNEDHLDPDIHLWPDECPDCENLAVELKRLREALDEIRDILNRMPSTWHKQIDRCIEKALAEGEEK